MKRTLATLAAMAAGIMMAAGSAEAQTRIPAGATASPGVLALAADFAAAPNQFIRPDGTRDGLNVDMCGALAEKLGAKLEWTNLAFPGLVPGLQAKRFDGLCTAIFINPDRLAVSVNMRLAGAVVVCCDPFLFHDDAKLARYLARFFNSAIVSGGMRFRAGNHSRAHR